MGVFLARADTPQQGAKEWEGQEFRRRIDKILSPFGGAIDTWRNGFFWPDTAKLMIKLSEGREMKVLRMTGDQRNETSSATRWI